MKGIGESIRGSGGTQTERGGAVSLPGCTPQPGSPGAAEQCCRAAALTFPFEPSRVSSAGYGVCHMPQGQMPAERDGGEAQAMRPRDPGSRWEGKGVVRLESSVLPRGCAWEAAASLLTAVYVNRAAFPYSLPLLIVAQTTPSKTHKHNNPL